MNTLRECVTNIGAELVETHITSTDKEGIHEEILGINLICKSDKKKVYLFEDVDDIRMIREDQSGMSLSGRYKHAPIVMWDKMMYFSRPDHPKTVNEWVMLFTKSESTECSICMEVFNEGMGIMICDHCKDMRCTSCDHLQALSECPVCRVFDPNSYAHKRKFYFKVLIDKNDLDCDWSSDDVEDCASTLLDIYEYSDIQLLIDDTMKYNGKKIYDRGVY